MANDSVRVGNGIAIGIAVLGIALSAPAAGQSLPAPVLTDGQCKAVSVGMGQVFEALPRDTLSLPFRQSATGFVRAVNACAGPHRIEITTAADAQALADLFAHLLKQAPPLDLRPSFEVVDRRTP
jgi:hypothetical protein